MMRSLLSAVASLQAHQARMDIIGNNIANVNTIAFKSQRASFQDMLSQTMRGASAPLGSAGGTNPMQIGLGVKLAAVDSLMSQGSLQMTGKSTDLAIQGNGYFMLSDGSQIGYTRDGSFDLDSQGYLVSRSSGLRLLGWSPTETGEIDTRSVLNASSQISVPLGTCTAAKATTAVGLVGNLKKTVSVGTAHTASVNIFDSVGTAHTLALTFTKNATGWDWEGRITVEGSEYVVGSTAAGAYPLGQTALVFDNEGECLTLDGEISISSAQLGGNVNDITATLDFSKISQLTDDSTVHASGQDGFSLGTLESFTVSENGLVEGVFTNSMSRILGQIALAVFTNPGGLERAGANMYRNTMNSGDPQTSAPSSGAAGKISTGFLEAANVDLGAEFADMIVTQRGFQANSRIVTVVDEMLQDLINLKR